MAPKRPSASSGSEGDPRDDQHDLRKIKRKESNRLSAKRSRERKQIQLAELQSQASQLKKENESHSKQINVATDMYLKLASQNDVLRAQVTELTDRLRSLNDVIQVAAVVNGVPFDTQEIPDVSFEPWRLPCPGQPISLEPWQHHFPTQPISASANIFQY
ncbi:hypothetical protein ACH5RR_019964 [Cinchona calisaya]|uniref:BZIP domain-containing protein n=1 Tax=Cinchona calisaya TaxID=153742 RepID=A0ABD2ZGD5_9GENT